MVMNSPANVGDASSPPGRGKRAWQSTPLFCLENPQNRGALQITVHKVAKSCTLLKWVFIGRTDAEAETPILWPPHEKS